MSAAFPVCHYCGCRILSNQVTLRVYKNEQPIKVYAHPACRQKDLDNDSGNYFDNHVDGKGY
jgi:hypothetical protein